MDTTTNQRKSYLDIARGLGMLAVIIAHIIDEEGTFRAILYTFHMPLFYILSGYLFKEQDGLWTFLKKKMKGIFVPYLFGALLISGFFYLTYNGFHKEQVFLYCIMQFVEQKRFTTLWFLSTLLIGLILFWFIVHLCRKNVYAICAVSTTLSVIFIIYDEKTRLPLIWNADTAIIILFYLAVGYLLNKKNILEKMLDQKKKLPFMIIGLLAFDIAGYFINYAITEEKYEMYLCQYGIFPVTLACACAGTIAIVLASSYLSKLTALEWFGRNTMCFMLFHQSIGIEVMKECLKQKAPHMTIGVNYLVTFIGVMVICLVLHAVIMVLHGGFLLGKTTRRKKK